MRMNSNGIFVSTSCELEQARHTKLTTFARRTGQTIREVLRARLCNWIDALQLPEEPDDDSPGPKKRGYTTKQSPFSAKTRSDSSAESAPAAARPSRRPKNGP
jgi:hypothetical protein